MKEEIKYFHLSPDDKFLDYVIENCEVVAPNNHVYVVRNSGGILKYVKYDRVIIAEDLNHILAVFNKNKGALKKIIIHFLTEDAIDFVNCIPHDIEVTWVFWGADGYALPKLNKYSYQNKTFKLLAEINNKNVIFQYFKKILKFRFGVRGRSTELIKAVERINNCATWVKGDYDLVKGYNSHLEYVYFNNNSIEQLLDGEQNTLTYPRIGNKYILLGNSGKPTNNHIEAMELLKDYSDHDIVVPLSYGDQNYINKILLAGKSILGPRFIPVVKFIPKGEYNSLLNNATLVIMNHLRQQASNNIITALWLGTPVLMNGTSPLYLTFKAWGIKIGEIGLLEKRKELFITDEEINANRNILRGYLGEETVRESYLKLLS